MKQNAIGYGERIKQIRKSMKLTLEQFGKLFDPPASKGLVRNWEIENNLPNEDRLNKISEIANVSVDYILYGKNLNGFGKRIKNIRTNNLGISSKQFGELFSPQISSNEVNAWESEDLMPSKQQIDKIISLGDTSYRELILGVKRKYTYEDYLDPFIQLEKTELFLDNSDLSKDERARSDKFFILADILRKNQVNNPKVFDLSEQLLEHLVWITGNAPSASYSYSTKVNKFKKFTSLEEETEDSIKSIHEITTRLAELLSESHKK